MVPKVMMNITQVKKGRRLTIYLKVVGRSSQLFQSYLTTLLSLDLAIIQAETIDEHIDCTPAPHTSTCITLFCCVHMQLGSHTLLAHAFVS